MSASILATKLYVPPPRTLVVLRPRLIERLNGGLHCKLTLLSAPAGFGKTTLVGEWIASCERLEPKVRVAWLSLDQADSDPARFLTYLISALQTISANIGAGMLGVLQASQPPPTESILTTLLNEIAGIPDNFILVLDDYHVMDAGAIDSALTFLLEHMPPQMHLVIATREDPHLPLARLRVRGQLTELRAGDLRFTPAEAADFLNQVMGLNLSAEDIAALETRTEGWIAGLQLAAVSMQGHQDVTGFIKSFTGSHHFVLDYLVEEVLQQQTASVQTFLLRTSILDRMCGPLCDAVLHGDAGPHLAPSASGEEILAFLEHANLFVVPLDNERRWYRYHHLFAELLRQRLEQSDSATEYHIRASEWYENNNLMLEAFHHAASANDIERATRLMESKEMPLRLPGAATAILNWLESLPTTVLNAQPALWWKQASLLLTMGQTTRVEEKLQATEAALAAGAMPGAEPDDTTRNLIGKIAVARAYLAQTQYQAETGLAQARRALEYLHPNNLPYRSTATQALGFSLYLQGDRVAASRAYEQALSIAQAAGDTGNVILATTRVGQMQEFANQLCLAAETYQRALQLIGEYPPPYAAVAYLGLARIYYEWNDLDAAEQYGEKSLQLARQYDQVIDRLILSEWFLAGLKFARGDATGAARMLSQTEQTTRQRNFAYRLPDIAAAQAIILLHQGNLGAAAELAQQYELPMSRARVLLAQGNPTAAVAVLELHRQQLEDKNWQDERLKVMVLQSVALRAQGEKDKALRLLGEALALAEPGGFVRLFVDEGEPMRAMIYDLRHKIESRTLAEYASRLLAAFSVAQPEGRNPKSETLAPHTHLPDGMSIMHCNWQRTVVVPPMSDSSSKHIGGVQSRAAQGSAGVENRKSEILVEPLSQRESEILRLIDLGLSNREIGERLFLALDTVKGHNRRIFDKLQVGRRTEALARARELSLL